MRKLILIISILSVFLATPAKAKLYDYYLERGLGFPSVEERVEVAQNCGISNYTGTFYQNIELQKCLEQDRSLGTILPTDNYDSFLSSPLSSAGTTIFVNAIPSGVTESIYTLYATDGTTPREKVKCTGTASSPYRLTGCIRGLSFSPIGGVIDETAGTGLTHSKNTRIAITDNINFTGKALNILGGNQETGGNTFKIGDNTTTTNKQIISANGDDLPYLQYNEATGKWQFSDDGITTYNMVDGGSGLTASTTKAIGITDSKIYINASSTTGMSFDSNGALYQKINSSSGVEYASGSAGIGINTSTLVSLIATSTPTAGKIVETGATQYIDNGWIEYPNATTQFNAGEAMDGTTTPVAVYLNATDGELYKADADYTDERRQVMGFVVNSTSDGLPAKLVTSGVLTIPYQATTTTVASQADQSMPIKTSNAITINNASDSPAWIIQAGQDTGNISSFVMDFTDVGGGANTYRADIYAVDSNNKPTGSALASSGTVSSAGAGDKTFTFATPYTLTPGQKYAVVLVITNYVGINQIGGANATTDNYGIIGSGTTMYFADNGGAWAQAVNCYFITYTTQLKYPYGSGIFLSSTAGGYSLTGTTKIGELLSQTKMQVVGNKERYLGSISLTDLGAQTSYIAVPPKTNKIFGTGTQSTGTKQSLTITREKTTSYVGEYNGSAYNVVLTWSGNTLTWAQSAGIAPDDIELYFYSY